MAEFLLRAKPHWKDTWDSAKLATLSQQELRQYNARTQIGDIVIVRPDGWVWGNEECLPNFLVVKVPGVVLPHNYEESLNEDYIATRTMQVDVGIWNDETEKAKWIARMRFLSTPTVDSLDNVKMLYTVTGEVTESRMIKHRKFQVPIAWMNSKIADGVSVITITLSVQKTALINSIIEKTS
jgi:hypothetical protein